MANRRAQRPRYVPKPKEIEFNVNIWGDRIATETTQHGSRLDGFQELLRAHGFRVQRVSEPAIDGEAKSIAVKLKMANFTKSGLFESLRRQWCTSVCRPGTPVWLESSEVPRATFHYRSDATRQVLQPLSFSLGSFFDRGTYIKHWSSEDDVVFIEDGFIRVEFEHDTKSLYVIFAKSGEPEGFKEIRLEMGFKQFESYVLVDENTTRETIEFYFPLQVPPKAFQEVTIHEYTNYDRLTSFLRCTREDLGSSSVLCLSFPLLQEVNVALELMSRMARGGFSIYFAAIKTKVPRGPTEAPTKPEFLDFHVTYALECLLSRGYKVRDRVSRKFYDLLRQATNRYGALQQGLLLPSDKVRKALYHLVARVETNRFCPLEYYLENLLYGDMKHLAAVEFEIPKHYAYVPRLIVTPTQDYLVPPELVAENRVIREYGHKEAMRIAFREEDFSKLASTYLEGLKHVLRERVVGLLTDGILIGRRRFEFLACSNSQLRDHGAWLYATDGEVKANDIRGSLGELESIRCVATFVSRMGQCFSSTKESIKVNIDRGCRVEEIRDIEVGYRNKFFECCNSYRTGTYTFSDGVGKINSTLARKVSESLGLDPTPSAYQIRYGGCKGMLAIDPSLPGGEGMEILLYRKSMKKFDSPHSALEICETTKPNLLYLNRQCILLLSGLGVLDEAFIGLQDNMLRHLASMLLFETVALETLRRANIPGGLKVTALSRSGVNVTREPFFRSLLLAIYKSRLGDLLRRARIAIPETQGRLLMGVIDETGSLEYGQVFVRYSELVSEPGRGVITLKRKVVISKNPCFHPGDMRTFDAVDVTALHHLVDCVVFPAKGPRPHTDEMSGSDLDGDKYFVTWYDRLMPKRENVEPMDFTSPEKIVLSRPVQVSDMIQFVSDYIKNDQLGIIANAHLVHADSEEEGIFSKACIDLAHMHSDAVDFPKTGKCPSLPRDLRPDQYPDFMMKPGKPQYTSQRILGQLFRKCRSLDRAQRYSSDAPQTQVSADQDMIVPGYEQYMEDALEIRDRYNNKLETLMSLYGLKNEGEVITGCLVRVNTRLAGKTDEKFEVAQMIQASLSTLRANTRRDFYEEFGGEDEVMEELQDQGFFSDDVMKKASAWYMATYGGDTAGPDDIDDQENASISEASRDQPNAKPESSKVTLISFPWVVDRVLAKIKGAKQREREAKGIQRSHALNEVGDIITDQAAYYYTENFQPDLMRDRDMRLDEKHKLTSILSRLLGEGTAAPRLSLCGASLTGISVGDELEDTPPIEIYAHCGKWDASDQEQFSLLRRLSDSFRLEGSGQLLPNPPELIFTRSRGRLDLLKQQCHITADPSKMLKSAYVGLHVQRCPRLLHLLLVVMHWGRRRHLNGDFKNSFLSNEDLATLFVVFCERFEFIDKVERAEVETYASSLLGILSTAQQDEAERQWTDQVLGNVSRGRLQGFKDKVTPGNALIKFFEHYSTSADDDPVSLCSVKNPFSSRDEKLCPNVTPRERVRFSDAALHAFHELGQCCGLDSIMTSSNESTRELQETLTMPNTTWGALRFAEEFVAAKLSSLTEAQIFIRPAQRSSGYILEATGNYLTLHGVQNELEKLEVTCESWVYNHTVSGAPQFLFLNQTGQEDTVTYKKLQRDYAVNLVKSPLVSLLGMDRPQVEDDDVAERKFVSQLLTQQRIFKREYLRYMHGAESLTIKAEFGSIYVENVPPLQLHSSVGAAESTLSKNADPKVQSSQARNQHAVMRHKFIPLTGGGDGWTAVFPSAVQHSTPEETYTLGIKSGNKSSHTMTVVCDDNLNFCDVEIPPINWLVTDVKAPRPGNSKSRDVDFRITVSSQRNFEGEEKEKVMKSATYEKFRSKPVITKAANGDLEVTREFQNKMAFVRHDVTTLYRVRFNDSELFLRVRSGKKYNVKNARVLNNPKAFSNVQLCGEFKSDEEATTVARDVWAATKRLRPHITS